MRTASLRTTLVGVFLAATLSGTAPDIFVRGAARGRPGGPLLVDGGAQLICELSGALKKVRRYAENFREKSGFSCLKDVAQRVKSNARKLTDKIDAFIDEFENNNGDDICLADLDTRRVKHASTKNNDKLSGCRSNWHGISGLTHDVEEELNEKIEKFTGVGSDGESWINGVSNVFGDTRENGCPLTQHHSRTETHCKGKLDEYETPYGGLWEIKGVDYNRCYEYDCSCSGDYYSAHPKIYWIGDDDNDYANMLKNLREDLKTLKKSDESKCTNLHTALSTHTPTRLHGNNDNDDSHADGSDDVRENADGIETERQTGGSSGSADTNTTVVSENYGDSRARRETSGRNSRNDDSNPMRVSTDNNASTVPAQNSPLYTDVHISSNCHLGGVIFMFAGVFFGKTFIFSPIR
ncbi:putative variant surface glycoprotein, (VSG) [Trypanosoma vivax]|nr:putative variant surface glycoprotein, (VSG) [Trypanosoma vivax]